MSDDFTRRRNQRTMRGVIACRPPGVEPTQGDIDTIEAFKGYLRDIGHLPPAGSPCTPEQFAERRLIHLKWFPNDAPEEVPGE